MVGGVFDEVVDTIVGELLGAESGEGRSSSALY